MKRIAYISSDPGVPVFGFKGCSVHIQEGLRSFRRQGGRVTLFTQRKGEAPPPDDLADISVHTLPPLSSESAASRESSALFANGVLREHLEAHGSFDMVYERYSIWGHAGMDYARHHGIPGILEVNAPLIEEQRAHRTLIQESEAREVAAGVFKNAEILIAVSQSVATYLASYPGTTGKIHVIPNGVNPLRFSPDIPPTILAPHGAYTVGFVGTLKPWHGVKDLVDAFAQLHAREPQSRLLIVGDGPERDTIEAHLATLGLLQAAHLTGAVAPEEVPGFIASMDVGVAPYPKLDDCYFSPLKVFEYMASGLPVVASRIGQLNDLIQDGINGFLCPPGDASALAYALDRLRLDPALRFGMGKAARTFVLRKHTWETVTRRVLHLASAERPDPLLEVTI